MKKGILAVVIAAVVVVGAVVAFKTLRPSVPGAVAPVAVQEERPITEVLAPSTSGVAIADVVPTDVVVFLSAKNARSTWDLIKNSNFWKKASGLKVWEAAQLGTNLVTFQEQFKTNTGFDLSEENLFGLLGQDLSIALLGSKEGLANPQLLIMSQTDPRVDAKGKISQLLEKVKANVTTETVEYNGQQITRVRNPQIPGPEFNYAFVGNIFTLGIGVDDSSVRRVVDLAGKKSADSLASSAHYQDSVKALRVRGDLKGLVYVNMAQIVSLIKTLPTPEGTPAGFAAGLEQTLGTISSISAAIGFDKGMLVKLFFLKNKDAAQSGLLAGWEAAPKESASLKLLPEESLLLTVSNAIDLNTIWEGWQKNLGAQSPDQAKAVTDAIALFEQEAGIKVKEDLIDVLGDEFCFSLINVDMSGLFPFPHVAILARVKDDARALDVMKRLSDYAVRKSAPTGVSPAAETPQEAAPTTEAVAGGESAQSAPEATTAPTPLAQVSVGAEDYNGTEINFLEVKLPYQTLNPSYAVVNGFLVIGVSKDTVKSIIDVAKGSRKAITAGQAYKESTSGFNSKVNQIAFLNMERTLGLVIEITKWANNLQKARGEAAAQTDQLIQENVLPLLETLKVFKAVAVEAVNQDKGVEETLYVQMQDLGEGE